jgi:hypothetical protein
VTAYKRDGSEIYIGVTDLLQVLQEKKAARRKVVARALEVRKANYERYKKRLARNDISS